MNYKALGNSYLKISEVSFGCMSIGQQEDAGIALIREAIDLGINFFDTADLYDKGLNETIVGKALEGIRDQVVLATKVGNQWRDDGSGWDWNPGKAYIISAVEQSLKRLRTDHIDLYQLHGGTIEDPIDETIEAFEQLVKAGKIRYYGISSIRPNVIRAYVERSNITSVMMQYSLLDRRPEASCLQLLQHHNIGVLARGSVAKGLLVDKQAEPYLDYTSDQVSLAREAIATASGKERRPAQTAIQYVLKHPAITSAVVGIRTQQQLEEAAAEVPRLDAAEYETLTRAVPRKDYTQHI